jgi:hypothetical protein
MRNFLLRHFPQVTRPMWIFLASVLLGFSILLTFGLFGAVISGELHQYSKGKGSVVLVLSNDASSFWLEVGMLVVIALFMLAGGVFSLCAYSSHGVGNPI